ncbi:MAG: hypothetical protein M1575_04010 [Patescibacteria group bacterium]|nr:hypothetical protein [Patescibacteria group bacterium]MCL5095855.1 hypothetical protein [Patescibacteria group bacterium]
MAEALGPENIRGLEEKHKVRERETNRVDVATKNNIAIECKTFVWKAAIGTIQKWIEQAVVRLRPDEEGHRYNSVLIVIPEDKNPQEINSILMPYLHLNWPEFSDKIRVCRISELKENLVGLLGR